MKGADFLKREPQGRVRLPFSKRRDHEAEALKASERMRALPESVVLRRANATELSPTSQIPLL
jgi:hypothetical protein